MRRHANWRRQRGAALIVLAAALVLGLATIIVIRANEAKGVALPDQREHNAVVLEHAKKTLIGYVATNAARSGEDNPGRLPCPEPSTAAGTASEGLEAASCNPAASQHVGRLPWRTLGVDKLVDAKAEPLWYVVSPGWAYAGSNLVINSDTIGQLTVDSQPNSTVALIIAPDVAMNVLASAGCAARMQVRAAPAPGIDVRDYIECFDSATSTFSTTGASTSFNDQVVRITVADLMPPIEAAIAARIAREIVPALKTVYQPASWGFAGTNPVFPFPAAFADPSTSAMQGSVALRQGLLPATYAETFPMSGVACTPGPSAPRCAPTFVSWTGAATFSSGSTYSESCTVSPSSIDCTFYYRCLLISCAAGNIPFTVTATAANVGMSLRAVNRDVAMTNVAPHSLTTPRTVAATLNTDGSSSINFSGTTTMVGGATGFLPTLLGNTLCGLTALLSLTLGCKQGTVSIPLLMLADHALLDAASTGPGATGWYVRNRWHELSYYAIANGYTPAGVAGTPSCATGTNCLSVANVTPAGAQRAIVILAGRSINGAARPSTTLGDYLEFGNASSSFERQPVSVAATPTLKNPFNDRIVVVDEN